MTQPTNLVWPKLLQLADCLCTAVRDSGLDPLCSCGVQPGAAVAYDFISGGCKDRDGMGWVRMGTAYMTRRFPAVLVESQPCNAEVAFTVDMGIVRTMPLGKNASPGTAAMFLAAAERQITEMNLMRRALLCCYGQDIILGQYTPVGPDGGAIGGYWTASVPTLTEDDR